MLFKLPAPGHDSIEVANVDKYDFIFAGQVRIWKIFGMSMKVPTTV